MCNIFFFLGQNFESLAMQFFNSTKKNNNEKCENEKCSSDTVKRVEGSPQYRHGRASVMKKKI